MKTTTIKLKVIVCKSDCPYALYNVKPLGFTVQELYTNTGNFSSLLFKHAVPRQNVHLVQYYNSIMIVINAMRPSWSIVHELGFLL